MNLALLLSGGVLFAAALLFTWLAWRQEQRDKQH